MKEQYPPSDILPAVAVDETVAETPPSVDESVAERQLEKMKLGEMIFPILTQHFPNSRFTGKALMMILEMDNKKIERLIENKEMLVNHANNLLEFLKQENRYRK